MRTPRTTIITKRDTTATLAPHADWRKPARETPGAHAAILKGCTCSPTDNEYGRGVGDGHRSYLIAPDCPLHGALLGGISTAQWRTL